MTQTPEQVTYHPEQIVEANGIQIAYDAFGEESNPPILMIAGAGQQLRSWREGLIRRLSAAGRYVIRFDNRDVGHSTWTNENKAPSVGQIVLYYLLGMKLPATYTLVDMAADVVGLLDTLKIASAHLVGMSMGGMIAQMVAASYPEKVQTITSIMSSARSRITDMQLKIRLKILRPSPDNEAYLANMLELVQLMNGPGCEVDAGAIRRHSIEARERGYNPLASLTHIAAVGATGDRRRYLEQIKAPTLVIHGADDPVVPVKRGREVAAGINDAQLVVIERMGHRLNPVFWDKIVESIVDHTA